MSCTRNLNMKVLAPQGVFIPLYVASQEDDFHPSEEQIEILRQTLNFAPAEHLRRFAGALGHIRASGRQCTPARGGGSNPAPWIRLSATSFEDSLNQTINVTALHEFGHVVDYQYGAMAGLHDRHPDFYRLLSRTRHTGRTQGPGEAFADCYMIYVITQLARRGYRHPADPQAYEGEQATRHFEALINSPAFDNWTGALSELRRQPELVAGTSPPSGPASLGR